MKSCFILVFFGASMKQDYQDDSSLSCWYPIKTVECSILAPVPFAQPEQRKVFVDALYEPYRITTNPYRSL